MKRFLLLCLGLMLLLSCGGRTVTFQSEQEGVVVRVDDMVLPLPVELEIAPETVLRFSHSRHDSLEVTGQEVLDSRQTEWTVDLGEGLLLLKIEGLGHRGNLFINGDSMAGHEFLLPRGEYEIRMEVPGEPTGELSLNLQEDRTIRYEDHAPYHISEYPANVTLVEWMGQAVTPEDPIRMENNRIHLVIHKTQGAVEVFLDKDNLSIRNGQIDLQQISDTYIFLDDQEWQDFFTLECSWIKAVESPPPLASFRLYPMGFEEEPPLITTQDEFIQETLGFYPDVSIGNPTDFLMGAQVTLECASETLRIELDEAFLSANTRNYYGVDYETWESGETPILKIMNLNFSAPYHGASCVARLEKDGQELDRIERNAGELNHVPWASQVGIYTEPRESFFDPPNWGRANRQYIYLSGIYEGNYIAFYKIDDRDIREPIFLGRIENHDHSPAMVQLSGPATDGLFSFRIVDNLEELQEPDPDVFLEEGRFSGEDA